MAQTQTTIPTKSETPPNNELTADEFNELNDAVNDNSSDAETRLTQLEGEGAVLNGTSDPLSGEGNTGDFFINTTSNELFGPKSGSVWGSGTSLVGPSGSGGAKVIVLGINGLQNVNNTTADAILWDDSLDGIKDSEFTHSTSTNPSRITVNQTGRYKIHLNLGITSTVPNSRLTLGIRTRVNGTTDRPEIIGGYARVSSGAGSDDSEVSFVDYLTLNSGDYIEIMKRRVSTTNGAGNTTQDGGSILIVSYEG